MSYFLMNFSSSVSEGRDALCKKLRDKPYFHRVETRDRDHIGRSQDYRDFGGYKVYVPKDEYDIFNIIKAISMDSATKSFILIDKDYIKANSPELSDKKVQETVDTCCAKVFDENVDDAVYFVKVDNGDYSKVDQITKVIDLERSLKSEKEQDELLEKLNEKHKKLVKACADYLKYLETVPKESKDEIYNKKYENLVKLKDGLDKCKVDVRESASIKEYKEGDSKLDKHKSKDIVELKNNINIFKKDFEKQKNSFEKRRDSSTVIFLKAVATVFSFGLASVAGLWKVKGKEFASQVDNILQSTPEPPKKGGMR